MNKREDVTYTNRALEDLCTVGVHHTGKEWLPAPGLNNNKVGMSLITIDGRPFFLLKAEEKRVMFPELALGPEFADLEEPIIAPNFFLYRRYLFKYQIPLVYFDMHNGLRMANYSMYHPFAGKMRKTKYGEMVFALPYSELVAFDLTEFQSWFTSGTPSKSD